MPSVLSGKVEMFRNESRGDLIIEEFFFRIRLDGEVSLVGVVLIDVHNFTLRPFPVSTVVNLISYFDRPANMSLFILSREVFESFEV